MKMSQIWFLMLYPLNEIELGCDLKCNYSVLKKRNFPDYKNTLKESSDKKKASVVLIRTRDLLRLKKEKL